MTPGTHTFYPPGGGEPVVEYDSPETIAEMESRVESPDRELAAVYRNRTASIAAGGYGDGGEQASLWYDVHKATNGSLSDKRDAADNAWVNHIEEVKNRYPKPAG